MIARDDQDHDQRLRRAAGALLVRAEHQRALEHRRRVDADRAHLQTVPTTDDRSPRTIVASAPSVGEHDRLMLESMARSLRAVGVGYGDLAVVTTTEVASGRYARLLTSYGVPSAGALHHVIDAAVLVLCQDAAVAPPLTVRHLYLPQSAGVPDQAMRLPVRATDVLWRGVVSH